MRADTQLSVDAFYCGICLACDAVIDNKSLLNRINVFPVADGDTGNNMASTVKAIKYAKKADTIADLLDYFCDASLQGARGNSGMILSQFFHGLADYKIKKEPLSIGEFARLIAHAALFTRRAMTSPVDGTMLTIIEAWAYILNQLAPTAENFLLLFEDSLPLLEKALMNTKDQLAVLKEADVVDAGAKGFVFFVEGFLSYFEGKAPIVHNNDELAIDEFYFEENRLGRPHRRYCCEAIIEGPNISKSQLQSLLAQLGDSQMVIAGRQRTRFHVHTNQTQILFDRIRTVGIVQSPKVDDMLMEYYCEHEKIADIAIVTDSSADIPLDINDKYHIYQIPINIRLGEHQLIDNYCIDRDIFYQNLDKLNPYPQTSLPSYEQIEKVLSRLSRHYTKVIVITVAKILSGTYAAITQVANKYNNVTVIDSKKSSGSQGLLVQYAAKLIADGDVFNTVVEKIKAMRERTQIFIAVNQLDAMIRSGRLSALKGSFAKKTHIKPLLTLDKEGVITKSCVCMIMRRQFECRFSPLTA